MRGLFSSAADPKKSSFPPVCCIPAISTAVVMVINVTILIQSSEERILYDLWFGPVSGCINFLVLCVSSGLLFVDHSIDSATV